MKRGARVVVSAFSSLTLAILGAVALPQASVAAPADDLAKLCDSYWQGYLEAYPTSSTSLGDNRYDDRHPTVGSAHAALESGFVRRKKKLTQECGAGIIGLSVEKDGIFLKAPAAKVSVVSAGKVLRALGAPVGDLRSVNVGPVWLVGEVRTARALARTVEEVARDSERDNFLTAKEAMEYGLVDQVLDKRV